MIDISFLTEAWKEKYKTLIIERFDRLVSICNAYFEYLSNHQSIFFTYYSYHLCLICQFVFKKNKLNKLTFNQLALVCYIGIPYSNPGSTSLKMRDPADKGAVPTRKTGLLRYEI